MTQIYYLFFGILTVLGGALGYVRARSRPSLIAGGISGGGLILAGLLAPSQLASWLALILSALLLVHFGRSYFIKRQTMPALPMIVLSVLCIILTLVRWSK
jgi:uncharacterized membrane protein (UPF0136 family)